MTQLLAVSKTRPQVKIVVNNKSVTVSGPTVTGLEVKEAAIAFKVEIELNFQLALVKNKKRRILGDDEVVRVEAGTTFVATAPDDNSQD